MQKRKVGSTSLRLITARQTQRVSCFAVSRKIDVSFKVYLGVLLSRFSWIFCMEDCTIIARD